MNNQPAIFSPVQWKWISKAVEYFIQGNKLLYFYTDSTGVAQAENLGTKFVYFKATGENYICAMAEVVDIVTKNPKENRLLGSQEVKGRYYYGFKNLKLLEEKIPLNKLNHYPSNLILRNDTAGVCIINDPLI